MNNMPKKLSKVVMTLIATCCMTIPAEACGPSFGPVGTAIFLGVLALGASLPVVLTSAGIISAVRARRDGLSLGKVLIGVFALGGEFGLARIAGPGSLLGVLAVGAGALQVTLFVLAAVNGPSQAPLPGRLTVLSQQALGF